MRNCWATGLTYTRKEQEASAGRKPCNKTDTVVRDGICTGAREWQRIGISAMRKGHRNSALISSIVCQLSRDWEGKPGTQAMTLGTLQQGNRKQSPNKYVYAFIQSSQSVMYDLRNYNLPRLLGLMTLAHNDPST